jgi:hypothetical protein
MRHPFRVTATGAQALGEARKFLSGFLGQKLPGLGGFQAFGVLERVAQQVAVGGVGQIGQRDGVNLLNGVCTGARF